MRAFMDQDFLLTTPTAQRLYHDYAEKMPIIDYHCHVDPREIFEDRRFENIYQIWLEGDHYKWRVMRSNGVDERYITGDAPEREKFQKFAEALPRAIGNPMYHWCHLELRTYFGYEGVLNGDTAQGVWDLSVKKLAQPDMSVRGILRQSNVAMVGTTDDPTSDLAWHKRIAEDPSISTVVAPSFRPDKALNLEKPGWADFLAQLGRSAGVEITDLDSQERALEQRMEAFDQAGCRAADHGLDYVPFRSASREQVDAILKKALGGQGVTVEEAERFKTALLLFCAQQHVHPPGVLLPEPQDLRPVGRHVRREDPALVLRNGGVAVARGPEGDRPGRKGRPGHLRQGVLSVAEARVGMDGTEGAHCIRSCFTLWSTTWRFSSSRVTSSTEMPIWTISTITW